MGIKQFIDENKEGMILGGIVGAVVFYVLKWKNINLGITFETQSIIDQVLSSNPITLTAQKTLILFILVGVALGAIVDVGLEEGWWKEW